MLREITKSIPIITIAIMLFVSTSALADTEKFLAEQKRKEELAECRKDIQCWGDRKSLSATFACQSHIEGMSNYSYEWTDGFFGSKLTRFRWKNKPKGIVTYIGDKIKFQNGFGAWQNYVYECDYDAENDAVLEIRARPGRIGNYPPNSKWHTKVIPLVQETPIIDSYKPSRQTRKDVHAVINKPENDIKKHSYNEAKLATPSSRIYEINSTITLYNQADTCFAIYKTPALKAAIILFTNGIRTTILDVSESSYKIKVREYTGWVPEGTIED